MQLSGRALIHLMSGKAPFCLAFVCLALAGCTQADQFGVPDTRPIASEETIYKTGPEFSSRLARGEIALADGRVGDAHESFVAAVQVSAGDPRAVLGLAESTLARGNTSRARQLLDQLNEGTPGVEKGRLYQARGILALRTEQPQQARKLLERSIDADASLWRAWINLGRLHLNARRNEDARSAFVMAEQTAPQSASAQNDLGMAHLRMENTETAIRYFERALVLDPGHSLAQANLRIVKAMQGDYRAAVVGVSPELQHDAYNNAGYAALMRGEYDVADRFLRRAIQLSPTHHQTAVANLDLIPE